MSLEVGVEKKIPVHSEEGEIGVSQNRRLGGLTVNLGDQSNPLRYTAAETRSQVMSRVGDRSQGDVQGWRCCHFQHPFQKK